VGGRFRLTTHLTTNVPSTIGSRILFFSARDFGRIKGRRKVTSDLPRITYVAGGQLPLTTHISDYKSRGGTMAAYASTPFVRPNTGISAYQQNQVNQASSGELLVKTYDIGITACVRGNAEQARAVVIELINSLNFDHGSVAVGLLRLYIYCLDMLRQEKFDETKHILSELRDTWAQAFGIES
jgi:flagellar protein FliS